MTAGAYNLQNMVAQNAYGEKLNLEGVLGNFSVIAPANQPIAGIDDYCKSFDV